MASKSHRSWRLIEIADIGLEFNEYDQEFRETVLRCLQTAKRNEHKSRMSWLLPLGSKATKNWHIEFPKLITTMSTIAEGIQRALDKGVVARDTFLNAGYSVIDKVAQDCAAKAQIQVKDEVVESILVQRIFVSPDEGLLQAHLRDMDRQYQLNGLFEQ